MESTSRRAGSESGAPTGVRCFDLYPMLEVEITPMQLVGPTCRSALTPGSASLQRSWPQSVVEETSCESTPGLAPNFARPWKAAPPASTPRCLRIEPADGIAVAVEGLGANTVVRVDEPLERLRPARVRHLRVHIGLEGILVRRERFPKARGLRFDEFDLHDRFDAFEAVLPRHDEPHRRSVLPGQRLSVNARGQQRERVHRLVHPQALEVWPRITRHLRHARRFGGAIEGEEADELRPGLWPRRFDQFA